MVRLGRNLQLYSSFVLLFVIFSLFFSLAHSNGQCSSSVGPVSSCQACSSSTNNFNDLAGVPRYNRHLTSVSNNLGSYSWFTCDANTGANCAASISSTDVTNALIQGSSKDSDPNSPTNYIESFVVYAGFGLVSAVLTIAIGIGILIARYCCCCITGGTCGKRHPTKKDPLCCCGLRVSPNGVISYPEGERWCARITLVLFFILVVVFVGVGWWNATVGIPNAVSHGLTAPSGFATVVSSTSTPIAAFLTGVLSDTLSNFSSSVSSVVTGSANPTVLGTSLDAILAATSNLPYSSDLNVFFNQANASLGQVNYDVQSLTSAINGVNSEVASLSSIVSTLQTRVNAVTPALALLNNDITLTLANITNSNATVALLINTNDGTQKIISDLGQLSNQQSSANFASLQSGLTDATQAASPTIRDSTTIPLLTAFITTYSSWPNFTTTAVACQSTNTRIRTLLSQNFIGSILSQLSVDQRDVNALVSTIQSVNASFANASSLVNQNTLDPIRASIANINATINGLPNFALLSAQLNRISALTSTLTVLQNVAAMITSINATIYVVPSQLNSIHGLSSSLNSSLSSAVTSINKLQSQISDFQSKIASVNVTDYNNQVSNMASQMQSASQQLNNGTYTQTLNSANATAANIDWATPTNALKQLNTSLANNQISPTAIVALFSLETAKESLLTQLQQVKSSFLVWATAPGTKRCLNTPTTLCSAGCPVGDTCVISNTNITNLQSALTVLQAASSSTALTSTATQMQNIQASSDTKTGSLTTQVVQAQASINNVKLNDFNTIVTQFNNAITSVNTGSIQSTVSKVANSVATVDFTNPRSNLASYNNSLTDVNNQVGNMQNARNLAFSVATLVSSRLPVYLNSLSAASLTSAYAQSGTSGLSTLLYTAASIIDDVATTLNANSTLVGWHPAAMTQVNKLAPVLNLLQQGPSQTPSQGQSQSQGSSGGAINFLANMYVAVQNVSKQSTTSGYVVSPGGRYNVDANGNAYPNNALCVTDDCLTNTFSYYYTNSLSTTIGASGVGISPQGINSYPYLIPLFIAIISVLSLFCLTSSLATQWATSSAIALIFIIAPLIFVYMAFAFPLVLLVNDVCYGGTNVGAQYIQNRKDFICSDFGGVGTATQCAFNVSSGTIDVNIPATYQVLVTGSCANTADPLATLWTNARSSFLSVPVTQVNNLISQQPNIRAPLRQVMLNAATSSTAYVSSLITGLSGTITCGAVASSVYTIKDTACCQGGLSVYLAVSSWYLIGFCMVLCGWPSLLLGRKRFSNQLWGPEVELLRNGKDPNGLGGGNHLDDDDDRHTPVTEMNPVLYNMHLPVDDALPIHESREIAEIHAQNEQREASLRFIHNDLSQVQNQPISLSSSSVGGGANLNEDYAQPPPQRPHPSDSMQIVYRGSEGEGEQPPIPYAETNNEI